MSPTPLQNGLPSTPKIDLGHYMPSEWPLAAVLRPQYLGMKTALNQGALSRLRIKEEPPEIRCSYCFRRIHRNLGRCGRCRVVHYCNEGCQRADFRTHMWECEGFHNADTLDLLYYAADPDLRLLVRLAIVLDVIPARERERARAIEAGSGVKGQDGGGNGQGDGTEYGRDNGTGENGKISENGTIVVDNTELGTEAAFTGVGEEKTGTLNSVTGTNEAKTHSLAFEPCQVREPSSEIEQKLAAWFDRLSSEANNFPARKFIDGELAGCYPSPDDMPLSFHIEWKGILIRYNDVFQFSKMDRYLNPALLFKRFVQMKQNASIIPGLSAGERTDVLGLAVYSAMAAMKQSCDPDLIAIYPRDGLRVYFALSPHKPGLSLKAAHPEMRTSQGPVPPYPPVGGGHEFTIDHIQLGHPSASKWRNEVFSGMDEHRGSVKDRQIDCDCPKCGEHKGRYNYYQRLAGITADRCEDENCSAHLTFYPDDDRLRCWRCWTVQSTPSLFETRKAAVKAAKGMISNEYYYTSSSNSLIDLTKAVLEAEKSLHPYLNAHLLRLRQDLFNATYSRLETCFAIGQLGEDLQGLQGTKLDTGSITLSLPTFPTVENPVPVPLDDVYASDDDDDEPVASTTVGFHEVDPKWCFTTALALVPPLLEGYEHLLGREVPAYLHVFYGQARTLYRLVCDNEKADTMQKLAEKALKAILGHDHTAAKPEKKADKEAVEQLRKMLENLHS